MSDFSIQAALELDTSDFKKNLAAAQAEMASTTTKLNRPLQGEAYSSKIKTGLEEQQAEMQRALDKLKPPETGMENVFDKMRSDLAALRADEQEIEQANANMADALKAGGLAAAATFGPALAEKIGTMAGEGIKATDALKGVGMALMLAGPPGMALGTIMTLSAAAFDAWNKEAEESKARLAEVTTENYKAAASLRELKFPALDAAGAMREGLRAMEEQAQATRRALSDAQEQVRSIQSAEAQRASAQQKLAEARLNREEQQALGELDPEDKAGAERVRSTFARRRAGLEMAGQLGDIGREKEKLDTEAQALRQRLEAESARVAKIQSQADEAKRKLADANAERARTVVAVDPAAAPGTDDTLSNMPWYVRGAAMGGGGLAVSMIGDTIKNRREGREAQQKADQNAANTAAIKKAADADKALKAVEDELKKAMDDRMRVQAQLNAMESGLPDAQARLELETETARVKEETAQQEISNAARRAAAEGLSATQKVGGKNKLPDELRPLRVDLGGSASAGMFVTGAAAKAADYNRAIEQWTRLAAERLGILVNREPTAQGWV